MIRVPAKVDISVTGCAFRAQIPNGILGVCTVTGDGCLNLLVYNDIDLDAGLGTSFEDLVKTPFFVVVRSSSQKLMRSAIE
jgi:hypothetical protein